MAPTKLLLTGATGYIGGSVLTLLRKSINADIKNIDYTVLVRKPEQAEYYKSEGINAILFENLGQVDLLQKAASEHDVVINTASAFQPKAAAALIAGLAERRKATGGPVHFIHTSGTSSIANRPVTKLYTGEDAPFEFSDKTSDIYEYELKRHAIEDYGQRSGDLAVFNAGTEHDVPTYILMSPTIYGNGTGAYNKRSIQIPFLIRRAIHLGHAEYIGEGTGIWDHAHIDDTADLYEIILSKLLAGEKLPSNKQGLYFVGCGRHTWRSVSEHIAKAGHALGVLKEPTARSGSLAEMSAFSPTGSEQFVELGFASRSVTNADLSRELGWNPVKTEADWEATFLEEFKLVLAEDKAN